MKTKSKFVLAVLLVALGPVAIAGAQAQKIKTAAYDLAMANRAEENRRHSGCCYRLLFLGRQLAKWRHD
jgi:hypothetical protein